MKTLQKPKIWLIIAAVLHTGPGVIIPHMEMGGGTENLALILYFLCVTVYLLYVAFMTEGQNQARLSVVLCAPVILFFIIGAVMKLEMLGMPVAPFPEALFPLIVWSLPVITGILNWNAEAESV
ncbi:MAG: hypothetical protein MK207_10030 [Saprospiraceae bacterium]|nr:hypothetical protein [Saprospiraceae bacterium]